MAAAAAAASVDRVYTRRAEEGLVGCVQNNMAPFLVEDIFTCKLKRNLNLSVCLTAAKNAPLALCLQPPARP